MSEKKFVRAEEDSYQVGYGKPPKHAQFKKGQSGKPNGRLELPRRIKPGSELVRTWNRRTYRVVVLENGFAHEGRTYKSLSEIASEITGTKWNGPRFFGLRRSSVEAAGGETNAS